VLELPLGAGYRHATIDAAVLAGLRLGRQRRAELRPDDQHHDVRLARRHDLVLEVAGGEHRLDLPQDRLDREVAGVGLGELLDHELRAPTLRDHITRRRDEYA
jgi:hypothetical protein